VCSGEVVVGSHATHPRGLASIRPVRIGGHVGLPTAIAAEDPINELT
jgi:hypothetical protein